MFSAICQSRFHNASKRGRFLWMITSSWTYYVSDNGRVTWAFLWATSLSHKKGPPCFKNSWENRSINIDSRVSWLSTKGSKTAFASSTRSIARINQLIGMATIINSPSMRLSWSLMQISGLAWKSRNWVGSCWNKRCSVGVAWHLSRRVCFGRVQIDRLQWVC